MSREKFVYEIAAYGVDVPEQVIIDSLSAIGLRVSNQTKADSLYAVLKKLPRCNHSVESRRHANSIDIEKIPQSWYDYDISEDMFFDFEDKLKEIHTESIVDIAGEILRLFSTGCNAVQADRLTADFLTYALRLDD